MTMIKSVWNALRMAVEIFDDAMRLRQEVLSQERYRYLER